MIKLDGERMSKPVYNVVSLSGGKDSTAMLLKMIKHRMQIDCILFCDTGVEFPQMYEHLGKLENDIGMPITRVKSEYSFEYLMFDKPVDRKENSPVLKKYGTICGYGFPGSAQRWCTAALKKKPKEDFLRNLRNKFDVKEYIGIAADEQYRLERKNNQNPNHIHPLVTWNMTEEDCLTYCYVKGYTWGGLYEKFNHVSCWCCPLKSLDELRQLYQYYPELWNKLKEWDSRTWRKFRADYNVEELETRFQLEKERLSSGLSINGRNKDFQKELKQRLNKEVK